MAIKTETAAGEQTQKPGQNQATQQGQQGQDAQNKLRELGEAFKRDIQTAGQAGSMDASQRTDQFINDVQGLLQNQGQQKQQK